MVDTDWGKKYKNCGCYFTLMKVNDKLQRVEILCTRHARLARGEWKVIR